MGYLYDLHVHSKECSGCSGTGIREMVQNYKNLGIYDGIVLTNHFGWKSDDISWEEYVMPYWNAYLEGKDEGEKCGLKVFFGLEYSYGGAQDVLLYGIDLDFVLANPDLCDITPEEVTKRVQAYGGFAAHAHPFRRRSYVPDVIVHMDMTILDGIEVYNAGNREVDDAVAVEKCAELGKIAISGSDRHHAHEFEKNPFGGMEFDFEINSNQDLVAALKGGKGKVFQMRERVHF